MNLSVAIITFNEASNIERCIKSVQKIADDIIVVDSYSIDNTVEIAQSLGARIVQQKFLGHIEQKNFAITQAKYPHILSLDADEALDETLIESIKNVKNNWNKSGYSMNRLTNYCGTWVHYCGWYPDVKLRLWDSRLGTWGGVNPHDKYEIFDSKDKIGHLKGNILHYSYNSVDDHYKQVAYFTDILAKSQYKIGKKAPYFILIFSPIVKFITSYFIQLGFLDGRVGFKIFSISAYATYLISNKLLALIKSNGASMQ
jgi:glycosyltransferase involved in cell wall biosynthesis